MNRTTLLLALLAIPVTILYADDADLVNERPGASIADREAHWNVDCHNAWHSLRTMVGLLQTAGDCHIGPDLQQELQLCAFIHQPPGEPPRSNCPDFQGAVSRLDTPCLEFARWLERRDDCPVE